MDESSDGGLPRDVRCLCSTGVFGGDVEGGIEESFGDADGDMADMTGSDESRNTASRAKKKTNQSNLES